MLDPPASRRLTRLAIFAAVGFLGTPSLAETPRTRTPADVPTDVVAEPAPSLVSLAGFELRQELITCTREDDDGATERVRGAVWTRAFIEPYFAPSSPEPAAVVIEAPETASMGFAVAVEVLLKEDGWIVGPASIRGDVWQRWSYRRGDQYQSLTRMLARRGRWEVAIASGVPDDQICPRWPPEEAYDELRQLSDVVRTGAIPWAWNGPTRREVVTTLRRARARDGASFAQVAEWTRYGGWAVGEREATFAEVLAAGRSAERSKLLPSDYEVAWSAGLGGLDDVAGATRTCRHELHLATYSRSPFEKKTYPPVLGADLGFPLREKVYGPFKSLRYALRVDAAGRVAAATPTLPLASTRKPHVEAMTVFHACMGEVLARLRFPGAVEADRTGEIVIDCDRFRQCRVDPEAVGMPDRRR